jgi:hypothetical protein
VTYEGCLCDIFIFFVTQVQVVRAASLQPRGHAGLDPREGGGEGGGRER